MVGWAAFRPKHEAHLRWARDRSLVNWEEFVRSQVRANETYSQAKRQFSVRNRDILMNAQSPHKWGSTLMSAEFGMSSSLPPLVGGGGGVVCVCWQCWFAHGSFWRQALKGVCWLAATCHKSPRLTTFAFRSSEVSRLLLDLDIYEGYDPFCMLPLFLKRTADVLSFRLSVVFRRLVCLGSFLACWRQANVTPISRGPPSSTAANYWPISITSVCLRCECLMSVYRGRIMEHCGVHPTTQFAYWKGLGACDALLCRLHTLQSGLESEHEVRIAKKWFQGSLWLGQLSRNSVYALCIYFCVSNPADWSQLICCMKFNNEF